MQDVKIKNDDNSETFTHTYDVAHLQSVPPSRPSPPKPLSYIEKNNSFNLKKIWKIK